MWIVDYCDKRLTECLRMSETFAHTDQERQRAWLDLAKQWGRLPEEILLKHKRDSSYTNTVSRSDARVTPAPLV
jgi:hypothetical protein